MVRQTSLSMRFSSQENRRGLPWPLPGDLPDPGTEAESLTSSALAASSLPLVPPGKPKVGRGNPNKDLILLGVYKYDISCTLKIVK